MKFYGFQKVNEYVRTLSASSSDRLIPVPADDEFYTDKLNIITSGDMQKLQAYRIISMDGGRVSDPSVLQSVC